MLNSFEAGNDGAFFDLGCAFALPGPTGLIWHADSGGAHEPEENCARPHIFVQASPFFPDVPLV